jgi:hypothetical protein
MREGYHYKGAEKSNNLTVDHTDKFGLDAGYKICLYPPLPPFLCVSKVLLFVVFLRVSVPPWWGFGPRSSGVNPR